MSENLEEYRMKFLVENYKTLREEIVVSISTQSKLIMGEGIAVAAGIILGFLGFGNLSMSRDDKGIGVVSSAFIIAIPFIIFSLTSLWTVEQGRMMRAGDFMQFLENMINRELEGAYIVWENWLRREGVKRLDVHRMHHLAQYLSILVFYGVGVFIIYLLFQCPNWLSIPRIQSYGLAIFLSVIFVLLLIPITKLITHQSSPAQKMEFMEWLDAYWNETTFSWEKGHECAEQNP